MVPATAYLTITAVNYILVYYCRDHALLLSYYSLTTANLLYYPAYSCQHTFPLKAALASDTRRSARTSTEALRDALGDDAQ